MLKVICLILFGTQFLLSESRLLSEEPIPYYGLDQSLSETNPIVVANSAFYLQHTQSSIEARQREINVPKLKELLQAALAEIQVQKTNAPQLNQLWTDLEDRFSQRLASIQTQMQLSNQLRTNCDSPRLIDQVIRERDSATEASFDCEICRGYNPDSSLSAEQQAKLSLVEKATELLHDQALSMEHFDRFQFRDKQAQVPTGFLNRETQARVNRQTQIKRQLVETRSFDREGRRFTDPATGEPTTTRHIWTPEDNRRRSVQQMNQGIEALNVSVLKASMMTLGRQPIPPHILRDSRHLRAHIGRLAVNSGSTPFFDEVKAQREELLNNNFTAGLPAWNARFERSGNILRLVEPISDQQFLNLLDQRAERFRGMQRSAKKLIDEVRAIRQFGQMGPNVTPAVAEIKASAFTESAIHELNKYHPQTLMLLLSKNPNLLPHVCQTLKRSNRNLEARSSSVMSALKFLKDSVPIARMVPNPMFQAADYGVGVSGAIFDWFRSTHDADRRQLNVLLTGENRFLDEVDLRESQRRAQRAGTEVVVSLAPGVARSALNRLTQAVETAATERERIRFSSLTPQERLRVSPTGLSYERTEKFIETLRYERGDASLFERGVLAGGIWNEMNEDRKKRGHLTWDAYHEVLRQNSRAYRELVLSGTRTADNPHTSRESLNIEVWAYYQHSLRTRPPAAFEYGTSDGLANRMFEMIRAAQLPSVYENLQTPPPTGH